MKVFIDCVGCEQRELDAERLRKYFVANGCTIGDDPSSADTLVLVSCAVDSINEQASVARMEKLLDQKSPTAGLLVGGCLPLISPATVGPNIARSFSPRTMDELDEHFSAFDVPMSGIPDANRSQFDKPASELIPETARDEYEQAKNGFKIRINQGCLLSCSYCAIRFATGRLSSVPYDDIVRQFTHAVATKESSIMLLGGDAGAYGIDLGIAFADLLAHTLAIRGEYRLFIHDFNVNWLLRDAHDLIQVFGSADARARLRGISFPIQSGSDRILKLMKRPYKSAQIVNGLSAVREAHPDLLLGTHIIVGFPGETDSDFGETIAVLAELQFDFITCFGYSENPQVKSALLHDKVGIETVRARLESLESRFPKTVKVCS